MQAVILAAGKGVRMRPLTESTPKPLLKVGGQAILDQTISQLPKEVDEVIIVVGYLKDQIIKHVKTHYTSLRVWFVDEPLTLGTAYALTVCKDLLHDNFLVLNGDDLYDRRDLSKLVNQDWAFLVQHQKDTDRFGIIETDAENNFTGISKGEVDKPGLVNIGAYFLSMDYFNYEMQKIKSGEFGLPQTILHAANLGKKVKTIQADYWFPIGFPEDLKLANERLSA